MPRLPMSLNQVKELHAQLIVKGLSAQSSVVTKLVEFLMDPHLGDYDYGVVVFRQIQKPGILLWNTLIRGASRNGFNRESIDLYHELRMNDLKPDAFTFSFLVKACSCCLGAKLGEEIHAQSIKFGFESNVFVVNSLINLYSAVGYVSGARKAFGFLKMKNAASWNSMIGGYVKCGWLDHARDLFDEMPEKDVVSWTTMLAAYAHNAQSGEAVRCFGDMLSAGIEPDPAAFVSVLYACSCLRDMKLGRLLHGLIERKAIGINIHLMVSLIDFYSKCGDMASARKVFDDMPRRNILVACNSIIDGYCKLGGVAEAQAIFDNMPSRDLISFNSMIAGYIQICQSKEAFLLFGKLRAAKLKPDKFTMVSLLSACTDNTHLSYGKVIHAFTVITLIPLDVILGTALLDMYSKCGRIDESTLVFNSMAEKDCLAWSAIINRFAMHGKVQEALDHFTRLQDAGVKLNGSTFIGVLSACSHGGLVEKGKCICSRCKVFIVFRRELSTMVVWLIFLDVPGILKKLKIS